VFLHIPTPLRRPHPLINSVKLTDQQDQSKFFRIGSYDLDVLILLIYARKLQNADFVVLFTFISLTDWRTGRCRARVSRVAELLGRKPSSVSLSVKRLKERRLMVPFTDKRTGEKLHFIHPNLLICGSGKQRGFLLRSFTEAIENNRPTPLPDDDYDQLQENEAPTDDLDIHG
jgi:hypothetical protein